MRHLASARFWARYARLPEEVRAQADKSYALLRLDHRHPSLHFKRIGRLWSARVSENYRVLGIQAPGGVMWSWIGSHVEYQRLLKSQLREPEDLTYSSGA